MMETSHNRTYCLCTDDGLVNRCKYILTDVDRAEMLISEGMKRDDQVPTYHAPISKSIRRSPVWYPRLALRILTLNGVLIDLFYTCIKHAGLVILIMFSSLLLTLRDALDAVFTGQPGAASVVISKVPVNCLLIACFAISVNVISHMSMMIGIYIKTDIQRRNRVRFTYIGEEMCKIDPHADTYTWDYNSEDDPDVAISEFRSSCTVGDNRWVLMGIMRILRGHPRYRSNRIYPCTTNGHICKCNH